MPRPKKSSGEKPAENRIEESFIKLVQEVPLEQISIISLTEEANCNRSTFYYHYEDIYDLLDKVIDRNSPKSIPKVLLTCFFKGGNLSIINNTVRKEQEKIDKLCILLNSNASAITSKKVKHSIMETWAHTLGTDIPSLNGNTRLLFEFGISGILAILAYRAETGMQFAVEDSIAALSPELPKAFLVSYMRHKSAEKNNLLRNKKMR